MNNTLYLIVFPDYTEIKKMRKALDITQAELASMSGVSQSTIAKIERGTIKGSYKAVVGIFEVLREEMRKHRKGQNADQVASRNVVSVQFYEKVKKASEMMREGGFSQLPVFDGPCHIGSVSENGILRRLRDGESMEELGERTLDAVLEEVFPIVSVETPLEAVTTLLSSSSAVLVTRRGEVTGIITSSDVLKLL